MAGIEGEAGSASMAGAEVEAGGALIVVASLPANFYRSREKELYTLVVPQLA
jgi:hypothetical protein